MDTNDGSPLIHNPVDNIPPPSSSTIETPVAIILGQNEPTHHSISSLHTWGESFDDRSAAAMRAGPVSGSEQQKVKVRGKKDPLQPQPSLRCPGDTHTITIPGCYTVLCSTS